MCYEIFKKKNAKKFDIKDSKLNISSKKHINLFLNHLKNLLDDRSFFTPFEKKQAMIININNLFYRFKPSDKELRIFASIISTLAKKNKKP